jgi:2-polyprenyl-6-methoxyphenol hydroxylase-like FAD-dependent oxidoreductase
MATTIETDYLIVGAGPAGASLACFMAQNGLRGIVLSQDAGSAETPRAHHTNPFALECLSDIGLAASALRMAVTGPPPMRTWRWVSSVLGTEYAKIRGFGASPQTAADVAAVSSFNFVDLPQSYLEPLLVKYATDYGFQVRFATQVTGAKQLDDGFTRVDVKDLIVGAEYAFRTRYLFGCDGGRSQVARAMNVNFLRQPSFGAACNILVEADLQGRIEGGREAMLHWIMNPGRRSSSKFKGVPVVRMVRPHNLWLIITFSPGVKENPFADLSVDDSDLREFVFELIGDPEVPFKVLRLDGWGVREVVAERFDVPALPRATTHSTAAAGKKELASPSPSPSIFLLGDAAHRHPPMMGLGSNTCIQDAYNLAWKLAFVAHGWAGPRLLSSYSSERQPVGAQIVRETNKAMLLNVDIWNSLGVTDPDQAKAVKAVAELSQPGESGKKRRDAFDHALTVDKTFESDGLGLCYNQWYVSNAVVLDDEAGPRPAMKEGDDSRVVPQITTYPGTRLPHANLEKQDVPGQVHPQLVSTQDIAGHGRFTLFISHGGQKWREAGEAIEKKTGIPLAVFGIGFGLSLDYSDPWREWKHRSEVSEDGCVLVRPDRFVAWRSKDMVPDPEAKLMSVLDIILARDELAQATNGTAKGSATQIP